MDQAVSEVLLKAATDTAVDVIGARTQSAPIRRVAASYRALGLIDTAQRVVGAVRVAAYCDVGTIVASEILIRAASRTVIKQLPFRKNFNFAVHQQAGEYLLDEDFTDMVTHDRDELNPYLPDKSQDFLEEDFESAGASLVGLTSCCIERGVRARELSSRLLRNEECFEPRRPFNATQKPEWLDKLNTGLGFTPWLPVPYFGVGMSKAVASQTYNGTFRGNSAEGYGRFSRDDGSVYFGQVRDWIPNGYGVEVRANGSLLAGHFDRLGLVLGAFVSQDRSKLVVGAHGSRGAEGFGRQIGLRHGIESASGFWHGGELTTPLRTMSEIYKTHNRENAAFFKGTKYGRELSGKQQRFGSQERRNDQEIVARIAPILSLTLGSSGYV